MLPEGGRLALDLRNNQSNLGNLSNFSSLCNQSNIGPLSAARDLSELVSISSVSSLQVALVFGLSVAMVALCVGGEAHLNPVVTITMALTLRLQLWRAVLYVIGQLLGAVASSALLLGLSNDVTPTLNQVSLTRERILIANQRAVFSHYVLV